MAQQETMTMMKFMERFDTEEKCREYLYKIRWPEGFVCPKCGAKDDRPFQIKSRHKLQCRHCTHQTSVTAGTIMDKSRTPLRKWFLAMYLMGQDKRGCSALKLQQELGIAYDTAWTMAHKIRHAMGERDAQYMLSGVIELDDAFFGGVHAGGKRGRGTDKAAVIVGVSLNEKGQPEFAHAQVCDSVNGDRLREFAKKHIEPGSVISSDGLSAYNKLKSEGYRLEAEAFDPKNAPEHLKWLHILVSNAKTFILGTYHGLAATHLQAYLDEYCFRFSRRAWHGQLFGRTLSACATVAPFTRYVLIG